MRPISTRNVKKMIFIETSFRETFTLNGDFFLTVNLVTNILNKAFI